LVLAVFDQGGELAHGCTYSGHPVSCAVALRNLDILLAERLWENAAEAGAYLLGALRQLEERPYVGEVRGKGLMLLIEVVQDKATKEKYPPEFKLGAKLEAATRRRGVIVRCTPDGIIMAPPLTISREECDVLIEAVAGALADVLE